MRKNNPLWSTAADIFSLGETLRQLLRSQSPSSGILFTILEKCTYEGAEERPSALQLQQQLEDVAAKFGLRRRHEEAWKTISQIAGDNLGRQWFATVLMNLKDSIESASLGFETRALDRCRLVANLLNQLMESYSQLEWYRKISISSLKHHTDLTGFEVEGIALECLTAVRNLASHGNIREKHLIRNFHAPSEEQMEEWSIEGARQLDQILQTDCLMPLTEFLLGANRNE